MQCELFCLIKSNPSRTLFSITLYVIAGSLIDILFFGVDGASRDSSTGPLPVLPVPVNYPMSSAFTLMPLEGPDYNATVSLTGWHV